MSSRTATDLSYERPKQNSRLFKRPVELRIEIYRMALQGNIESLANSVGSLESPPPVRGYGSRLLLPLEGALALQHTSSTLREESMNIITAALEFEANRLFAEGIGIKLRSDINSGSAAAYKKAFDTKSDLCRIASELFSVRELLSGWKGCCFWMNRE